MMLKSEGWSEVVSTKRKMVMNSCLKRLTSTGRKGDLGAVHETERKVVCG